MEKVGDNDYVISNRDRLTIAQLLQSLKLFSELYPSFIIFIKCEDCDKSSQVLPHTFIFECREVIIPKRIRLQMPNGHEIHGHYNKSKQSIYDLKVIIKECKALFGSFIVYSYKGNGIFSIHVFKNDLCEVDYFQRRTIPRAPMHVQDNMTGIGWKFMMIVTNHIIVAGEIPIPCSFWRRFGKIILEKVKLVLRNGVSFEGFYSQTERKMFGFQNFIGTDFIQSNHTVLLSYFGEGKFEALIFDKLGVENCLHEDSHSSEDSDSLNNDNDSYMYETGAEEIVEPKNAGDDADFDQPMTFAVVMKQSNINGSSHGAYIPRNIVPTNHAWESGAQVTLRTANGEWVIGLVIANMVSRLSSGWNRFCRENNIRLNETIIFRLVEEERFIFTVHFPSRS